MLAYKRFIIDQNLKGIAHWIRLPRSWEVQIEMSVAGPIFEPHPPNFGKSDVFWISTNDITTIFRNFHYYKSFKKMYQNYQSRCRGVLALTIHSIESQHSKTNLIDFAASLSIFSVSNGRLGLVYFTSANPWSSVSLKPGQFLTYKNLVFGLKLWYKLTWKWC